MNERDYNCFSCPHKLVCKDNSAARHQCRESIKNRITELKLEKQKLNKKYNMWIKNLKIKRRELK